MLPGEGVYVKFFDKPPVVFIDLIGVSELINTETGEIIDNIFLPYKIARFLERKFKKDLCARGFFFVTLQTCRNAADPILACFIRS